MPVIVWLAMMDLMFHTDTVALWMMGKLVFGNFSRLCLTSSYLRPF